MISLAFTGKRLTVLTATTLAGVLLFGASFPALAQYPGAPGNNYQRYEDPRYTGDYASYSEQAAEFYKKGEITKSIDYFLKALPLAPDQSVPVIYNNLCAAHIKRGIYYEKQGQRDKALSDYRMAMFYIDHGWPEGVERKTLHENNRDTAKKNLINSYRNLKINPADKAYHLETARQLRLQGRFKESIVEYAQAEELDKGNVEASKAIGDLFNVLNDPYKSKKYYSKAVGELGDDAKDDVMVQLGNSYYKTGEIDKAIQEYNKALEINPGNASALNQLQKIWENEIRFTPNSVLGHANLAGIYQKKKMYREAMEQYKAADHFTYVIQDTPLEVKKLIRLNMGTLSQEMKDYQMALKTYDTVLAVDPSNLMASYYKATLYHETGNTDDAIILYNKVLAIDPHHQQAHDAILKLTLAKPDKMAKTAALKDYAARYIAHDTVQSKVGEAFHEMGDYPNAALYYQNAIRVNDKLASAYANLGAVFQAMDKPTDAAAAYKKARELDPSNTTVAELANSMNETLAIEQYQQAVQLQQDGKKQEAKALLEQALHGAPNSPEIHSAYGITLQSLGQLDNAMTHYRKAIELENSNSQNKALYHYYLGTALHQKKDLTKALAEYKTSRNLDPTLAEANEAVEMLEKQQAGDTLTAAVEAFNRKKYAEALTLINKTITADPANATAHYYKGLIYNAQNNARGAAQSYKEAIRKDPGFTDAYYALGLVLDTQNDKPGAKQAFGKFIELSTGEDDFVRYAKERMKSL